MPIPDENNDPLPHHVLRKLATSETAIIATLPIAGTLVALLFEAGYLSYYRAPIDLIKIDLTKIFIACAFVAAGTSAIAILAFIIGHIITGKHPIQRALIVPTFMSAPLFLISFWSPINYSFAVAIGFFLIQIAFTFLRPLIRGKKDRSYLENLKEANEAELNQKPAKEKITIDIKNYSLLIVFVAAMVFGLGHRYASEKEYYFTVTDLPENIVVGIYGDTIIIAECDLSNKSLKNSLAVIPINQRERAPLKSIQTGALERASL
ncbi:hypothetical protein [Stutzerimonas balearica]|uniref:hypothetical protein n=1 Tax=Stutzerimonas balearica TaxID=74829 RepID=UPI00289EE515|nr:hypothetical protein [Stutzerimonas balearica]